MVAFQRKSSTANAATIQDVTVDRPQTFNTLHSLHVLVPNYFQPKQNSFPSTFYTGCKLSEKKQYYEFQRISCEVWCEYSLQLTIQNIFTNREEQSMDYFQ